MTTDKDKAAECTREWRKNHPGYDKDTRAAYRKKNRELLTKKGREYRENNREEINARRRENAKKNYGKLKEHIRNNKERFDGYRLKAVYGITTEDRNKILKEQNEKCAICGTHQDELKKPLFIDHNHKTGAVRGLLCSGCNMAIGLVKENRATIQNMMIYLIKDAI